MKVEAIPIARIEVGYLKKVMQKNQQRGQEIIKEGKRRHLSQKVKDTKIMETTMRKEIHLMAKMKVDRQASRSQKTHGKLGSLKNLLHSSNKDLKQKGDQSMEVGHQIGT